MEIMIPAIVITTYSTIIAFVLTWQKMHYLRKDHDRIDEKHNKLKEEIYELKQQINELKWKK